jgi:Glucodextranase, domain B
MQRDFKKILRISGISLLFLIIVLYAFFRSYDLIFGVKIKNVNLVDGTKYPENVIKISGNAKNAVNLTLNGREISVDQQGNFGEDIALLPGYNIVSIVAKDKFGHIDEKDYKLTH